MAIVSTALVPPVRFGQNLEMTVTLIVVSDIEPQLILGMDCITHSTQKLVIDIPGRKVNLANQTIPFHVDNRSVGCKMVTTTLVARVSANTVVPARSEKLLWLRVNSADEQGVFEPNNGFVYDTGQLASRVFATSTNQRIPV